MHWHRLELGNNTRGNGSLLGGEECALLQLAKGNLET